MANTVQRAKSTLQFVLCPRLRASGEEQHHLQVGDIGRFVGELADHTPNRNYIMVTSSLSRPVARPRFPGKSHCSCGKYLLAIGKPVRPAPPSPPVEDIETPGLSVGEIVPKRYWKSKG